MPHYDNLRCDQPNCNLSTQFTITGLSDSANLVGYYEKNAFGVRLAYNWRDDFLSAVAAGVSERQEPAAA